MVKNVVSISFSKPETPRALGKSQRPPGSLEPFLIGPENSLLRVALETAYRRTTQYGPVTVCGSTGMGKSHFLQGVAHEYATRFPSAKIIMTTGSDFARAFASAVESGSLAEFRNKQCSVSLLIIDDLQELATKATAQTELLQILDALERHESHVFTATRCPLHELTSLVPALRSRLSAGLTIPIATPSAITRRAMVHRLAQVNSVAIPDPVMDLLVEGTSDTPSPFRTLPELRHAVLQLTLTDRQPSCRISREAVAKLLAQQQNHPQLPIREITKHVARHFRLKLSDLTGSTRRQAVVQARGIAIHLARKLTGASYQQIGCQFGDRDHTTIMHACRRTERLLRADPDLLRATNDLAVFLTRRKRPAETHP